MEPAGELAELFERELEVFADAVEHRFRGRRVVVQGFLGHAQVEGEGDEALLGAVVEVAFESPPLGVGGVHDARARVSGLRELGSQLGEEPLVVEREAGGAGDGVEQGGVLAERNVVDERRDLLPAALEDRDRSSRQSERR